MSVLTRTFTHESTLLAIESSCDETSVAVLKGDELASVVISSQKEHAQWGGVVPELASRAHLQQIMPLAEQALKQARITVNDIEGIAVTNTPGLIGALVVGTSFAKGLALRYGLPLTNVNHIEGHIYSGFLEHDDIQFPFISLVVSGGHTSIFLVKSMSEYEVIGSTVDDAAGEAFDKIAKMLGLGYPGGAKLDKIAKGGNPDAYAFPRGMVRSNDYNFSFSGLKTSVRVFLSKNYAFGVLPDELPDICASAQEAIVDVLVTKVMRAATEFHVRDIVVAGGVSANSRLREEFKKWAARKRKNVIIPSPLYCTDNAAMIGLVGRLKLLAKTGNEQNLGFTATAASLRAATER